MERGRRGTGAGRGTAAALTLERYRLTTNVPFQFTVNEKIMPAGTYELLYTDFIDETSMTVRATNGTAEGTFLVPEAAGPEEAAKTELVFDKIGNRHFLRQIWIAGEEVGHEIALTKAEKELMGNGTIKSAKHISADHSRHNKM